MWGSWLIARLTKYGVLSRSPRDLADSSLGLWTIFSWPIAINLWHGTCSSRFTETRLRDITWACLGYRRSGSNTATCWNCGTASRGWIEGANKSLKINSPTTLKSVSIYEWHKERGISRYYDNRELSNIQGLNFSMLVKHYLCLNLLHRGYKEWSLTLKCLPCYTDLHKVLF